MRFPDLDSVENHLNSLINYEHAFPLGGPRDRPKLDPTLQAVERLSLSLSLPGCVHIAGTKGKGSVVCFLEGLLTPDAPVLSFTSPHLTSFTERLRYGGKPLAPDLWQRGFEEIVPAFAEEPAIRLTYFETTWVMFLWAARALNTAVNLVEAGLGGKWDATNVLTNTMAVLTSVDYDHTDVLGDTLTEIAADKAGIIKEKSQVIIGRQPDEALRVFRSVADSMTAHACIFGDEFSWTEESADRFQYQDAQGTIGGLSLNAPGLHQRDNAAVALRVARLLRPELSESEIRTRLAACTVPARQQLLPGAPEILIDVAHNPVSFRALAETIRQRFSERRILMVFGMMRNKDATASLSALKGLVRDVVPVELNSPRSAKQADLREIAESLGMNVVCPPSLEDAFRMLHERDKHNLGLVAGSFYLAGDYLLWRRRAGIA
ncbi:hypothetical protein KKH27_10855 [bacterium]|nr:hypothetical protein [bacterium]MBU1985441.1 hypothetical protein [bacterium]